MREKVVFFTRQITFAKLRNSSIAHVGVFLLCCICIWFNVQLIYVVFCFRSKADCLPAAWSPQKIVRVVEILHSVHLLHEAHPVRRSSSATFQNALLLTEDSYGAN